MIIPESNNNSNKERMIINTMDTLWNLNSGELTSYNKVSGFRSGSDEIVKYNFQGKSLKANTQLSSLRLTGCKIFRNRDVSTISDKCLFNFYVLEDNTPYLEPRNNVKYILKDRKERESIEFISNENRVNTRLKILNLDSALDLIN